MVEKLPFYGKRVLVGGSTSGIGLACAIAFASQGAAVTLLARNTQKLETIKASLCTKAQQEHHIIVADYEHLPNLNQRIHQYAAGGWHIDIVINNTGGPKPGNILQAGFEDFSRAFNNHVLVNQALAKVFIEGMKAKKYGRIINIISTSVKQPIAHLGVSNTIRAAVANWSKTLSNELAPFGITVNNVLPGSVESLRLNELLNANALEQGISFEAAKNNMLQHIPMERFAQMDEIAAGVLFLASGQAAYITGINLPIDGGKTASL